MLAVATSSSDSARERPFRWAARRVGRLLVVGLVVGAALPLHADAGASGGWAIVSSPNRSTSRADLLNDVTCPSRTRCWAVGDDGSRALVERWNGTSWSLVSSPKPTDTSRGYNLNAVACAASSDCWAVGQNYAVACGGCPSDQTLIEHWNGTAWSIVASPNPLFGNLFDATCYSSTDCWSVGYTFDTTTGTYPTLIEHWDGTSWATVVSPSESSAQSWLNGVSCASASECWAVGTSPNSSTNTALIDRWNGVAWSAVAPPTAGPDSTLGGVTCVSGANCSAVGEFSTSAVQPSTTQTLVEHWSGSSWSVVNAGDEGSGSNALHDVACTSSTDCSAVGEYDAGGVFSTLTEGWNGHVWSVVPSPNASATTDNVLHAVTCHPAPDCWAVGEVGDRFHTGGPVLQTLVEELVQSPPVFTADTPPGTAGIGTAYSYAFAATGEPVPSFLVASGTLPPGLTLSGPTGVLSGSPTATGQFQFRIRATNGVSPAALTSVLTITVA